ncbi:hypothetical protein BDW59DRAFT_175406 [Aspergillus cavernicola]|uniref:Zn(2)-C6 fungal-type domain-containing protein n=1 Tax=Aspergillus cavernicola TaxID=176166 RepID=A0ABR4HQC6_9EURO
MNKENEQKIRSRRSHTKSRLGCGNCKKRRVKCDEKRPICGSCLQHSINCDFSAPASSPSEGSTPPRRYEFRQSKYQSFASPPVQDGAKKNSVGVQCNMPPSSTGEGTGAISMTDLHIFHHFVTSTYLTIADETADPQKVWQIHVPRWGMSFPSIMHLILALSALHLAYLHPHLRQTYISQADEHFTFGVRSVTTVLALDTLDSENCQLIYISAVMICFAYFARGPRDGEYLVFNARGKSEWLVLLHGVRAILAEKRGEIFTGVLEPAAKDDTTSTGGSRNLVYDLGDEQRRHKTQLRGIRDLVMAHVVDLEEKELYLEAVDDLISSFDQAYECRKYGYNATELMPYTIGWTFRLPPRMIDKLEEREPVSLVILAHWAILLRYMRGIWYMTEWDEHIVRGIRACLPGGYHEWIRWPEKVIHNVS